MKVVNLASDFDFVKVASSDITVDAPVTDHDEFEFDFVCCVE